MRDCSSYPGRPTALKRFFVLFALGCVPVVLTACDLADYFPDAPQPVSVISPGYQVRIDGQAVPVSGFDKCPPSGGDTEHAAQTDAGHCIVLSEGRKTVRVSLHRPGGSVTETWQIIRARDAHKREITRLQRPDGQFVMAANP
ncbi:hypothetical protein [Pantoea sp. PNA 03-3]|uniref:hypothetical protein n=1 Tax=Pantoea TaxID=53335 RepID=UPI000D770056|nr:hypothetical protein [Pantoea sp. PNA 03-3]PXV70887.1 hypothetical protein C7433_11429 [Pantoea sp. PNA 03-3]